MVLEHMVAVSPLVTDGSILLPLPPPLPLPLPLLLDESLMCTFCCPLSVLWLRLRSA